MTDDPNRRTVVLLGRLTEQETRFLDEIVRLRARIAELETKLAEAEAKLEQGGFY